MTLQHPDDVVEVLAGTPAAARVRRLPTISAIVEIGASTGSATISVRGTMICPAVRSENPNTRCSICSSSSSRTPASWLAVTSIFSSSSECTSEWPLGGFSPTRPTTKPPSTFSTLMKGKNARMKSCVGGATTSSNRLGVLQRQVFGASSPSTMCSAVITANEITTAIECAVMAETYGATSGGTKDPTNANIGSIELANAGSPTQPRPRLAIVMPSCVDAM